MKIRKTIFGARPGFGVRPSPGAAIPEPASVPDHSASLPDRAIAPEVFDPSRPTSSRFGVRPSPGAAIPEPASVPDHSASLPDRATAPEDFDPSRPTSIAAPGDGRTPNANAFSLIEILVTVGLLTFIILGLLGMFTQTQRAFTSSMTQTDMLEVGRGVMGVMVPEFERMTPAPLTTATNFFVEIPSSIALPFAQTEGPGEPLYMELPGLTPPPDNKKQMRTNLIQRCFFLSQVNQDWVGTGYVVVGDYANCGVGTLYRFSRTNTPRAGVINLSSNFITAPLTNLTRIADGVVHFQVRAYDTNGYLLTPTNWPYLASQGNTLRNVTGRYAWGAVDAYFTNNAVPGSVEIELGVLESRVWNRYRAISSANSVAQRNYLSNHVAQVHMFRQRVPIRNVDVRAYQ